MSLRRLFASPALSLALAGLSFTVLPACGGGATGLQYRVDDKELRELTGEGALRIEGLRGEVRKREDALQTFDSETEAKKRDIASAESQGEAAADAIDAASDKIEATQGSEEKELDQARSRRDQKISEVKQQYEKETRDIRERFGKQQDQNRAALQAAKGNKAVADALEAVHQAELAEANARLAVRKQEVRVAEAELEVTKLDELLKLTGVVGPAETERKTKFDAQLAAEKKALEAKTAEHQKKVAAVETAKGKLEQERARAGGK